MIILHSSLASKTSLRFISTSLFSTVDSNVFEATSIIAPVLLILSELNVVLDISVLVLLILLVQIVEQETIVLQQQNPLLLLALLVHSPTLLQLLLALLVLLILIKLRLVKLLVLRVPLAPTQMVQPEVRLRVIA